MTPTPCRCSQRRPLASPCPHNGVPLPLLAPSVKSGPSRDDRSGRKRLLVMPGQDWHRPSWCGCPRSPHPPPPPPARTHSFSFCCFFGDCHDNISRHCHRLLLSLLWSRRPRRRNAALLPRSATLLLGKKKVELTFFFFKLINYVNHHPPQNSSDRK